MPAYNVERFVRAAVESILAQTFVDIELVVVDDASSDGTAAVLSSIDDPRLITIRHAANRGQGAALNTAIDHARGEYLAVQDADDISFETRLETQLAVFEKDPTIVIVGSSYRLIDEGGRTTGAKRNPTTDTRIRWHALFRVPFRHSTVMYRARPIRANGLRYSISRRPAVDADFFPQLLLHGGGLNIDKRLVSYRVHDRQITSVNRDEQERRIGEIVREQLQEIGVKVDLGDIPAFRRICALPPHRLTEDELRIAKHSLEAAAAFQRAPWVDPVEARLIMREVIDKLIVAARCGGYRALRRNGTIKAMLREDAASVVTHPVRAGIAKLQRLSNE
jgi:glycosyltransferase involved in cell wall biosynthesis